MLPGQANIESMTGDEVAAGFAFIDLKPPTVTRYHATTHTDGETIDVLPLLTITAVRGTNAEWSITGLEKLERYGNPVTVTVTADLADGKRFTIGTWTLHFQPPR